ncbi:hypothetical protein SeMB42_g05751 [Synchytrium endobioticum]|uniref:Uncharacterized protein n=2 Tax=Synchytrium endobioticum TaxID=286115 RepID=A0A507CPK9_9FUNG|nr:hypothetical protein SeMB42_g05751 [Synchytrium endobioticum]
MMSVSTQAAIEDSALRMRTIVDMKPLRKTTKYLQRLLSVDRNDSDAAKSNLLQFQLGVRGLELALRKHELMDEMNRQEVSEYKQEEARIEREMGQVQSTIEKLRIRLAEAQQERANKAVYEELAKQAMQHKSRDEMAKRIAQHKRDIEDLKEESKMFDLRWELRRKQFTTTALALHDFQTMLKDGNDTAMPMSLLDDGVLGDEDEEEGAVEETGADKDHIMVVD